VALQAAKASTLAKQAQRKARVDVLGMVISQSEG